MNNKRYIWDTTDAHLEILQLKGNFDYEFDIDFEIECRFDTERTPLSTPLVVFSRIIFQAFKYKAAVRIACCMQK